MAYGMIDRFLRLAVVSVVGGPIWWAVDGWEHPWTFALIAIVLVLLSSDD